MAQLAQALHCHLPPCSQLLLPAYPQLLLPALSSNRDRLQLCQQCDNKASAAFSPPALQNTTVELCMSPRNWVPLYWGQQVLNLTSTYTIPQCG